MNVLMVAAEAVPYRKTGGVADVVGGLTDELRRQGHDARIIIPRYRLLQAEYPMDPVTDQFDVPLGAYSRSARVWKAREAPVYFIENDFYFERDFLYGYLDEHERFIFFTRAVLEMLRRPDLLEREAWRPEVIHGHDWIAGLIPNWLRLVYADDPVLKQIAFVYTIHNIGYQGTFPYRAIKVAELDRFGTFDAIHESVSQINFMGRGILSADMINTVSPQHAREILEPEFGERLDGVLRERSERVTGILNGLDYRKYNPAFDTNIARTFDRDTLDQRLENKRALQEECSLPVNDRVPLLGIVNRLVAQKGFDLFEPIAQDLLGPGDVQLVLLGSLGDRRYQEMFTHFVKEYPQRVAAFFSFDEALGQRIFAGCDLILVPSLYEPCGLQQMIGMRYGAVPVVRHTGGLADTVKPYDPRTGQGNGFVFEQFSDQDFLAAIQAGLELHHKDPIAWRTLQRRNMECDFSWRGPAGQYIDLYRKAMALHTEKQVLPPTKIAEPQPADLLVQAMLEASELAMAEEQDFFLDQAARIARELVKGDAALIWIADEVQSKIEVRACSLADGDTTSPRGAYEDLHRVFSEGGSRSWRYVYRLDASSPSVQQQLGFLESKIAQEQKWAAQLSAPMNARGMNLGKIDVFLKEPAREFAHWEVNALAAFANSVAVSLENVRLNAQTGQLLDTDRHMLRARTLDDIVEIAMRRGIELTHAEMGRLYLLDETGEWLDVIVSEGLTGRDLERLRRREGIPGEALKGDGQTVNVLDVKVGPRLRHPSPIRSELAVPIRGETQVTGVLDVISSRPAAFSREDEQLLEKLAAQVAETIQAARLRDIRDRQRTNELAELANALAGELAIDQLVKRIVETCARILRAQASSLYLWDEEKEALIAKAATGYQEILEKKGKSYKRGEGVTGWIFDKGEPFNARTWDDLRHHPAWKGKQDGIQGTTPRSFYGLPLKVQDQLTGGSKVIGVLKIEDIEPDARHPEPYFTDQDELLIQMMANVIAVVIENTQLSDKRVNELAQRISEVSAALAGELAIDKLVKRIVETCARILRAQASSLYLWDEEKEALVVKAATGYQEVLEKKGKSYERSEGITGSIFDKGEPFNARTWDELRKHPAWKGKQDEIQHKTPRSFYGLPLKVQDQLTGGSKVIGVLKIEDIEPDARHPEDFFTDQDQLLIQMMANIIAMVIDSARQSALHERNRAEQLKRMSDALTGELPMDVLLDRIVETSAQILHAGAAALFLLDEETSELQARAGTGYQAVLVKQKVTYKLGEGITGWIAETGERLRTRTLDELHAHPAWKGKTRDLQDGKEPKSFLAIPLKVEKRVIGVLKVEDKDERHPEPYFTEREELLLEMMGNIITIVVENAGVIQAKDTRIQILEILTEVSRDVAAIDLRTILSDVASRVIRAVGENSSISFYTYDPIRDDLHGETAAGPVAEWFQDHCPRESGTGRQALTQKRTQFIESAQTNDRTNPILKEKGVTAYAAFPLLLRDEPLGVMYVHLLDRTSFTADEKLMLDAIARFLSVAVWSDRLRQQISQTAKSLGSFSEPQREAPADLLKRFVVSSESWILDEVALVLSRHLDANPANVKQEIEKLVESRARPGVFRRIAEQASDPTVKKLFQDYYHLFTVEQVDYARLQNLPLWQETWEATLAALASQDTESARQHFVRLAEQLAQTCGAKLSEETTVSQPLQSNLFGLALDASAPFHDTRLPTTLPLLFSLRCEGLTERDIEDTRRWLAENRLGDTAILVLFCDEESMKRAREILVEKLKRPFAKDVIAVGREDLQQIIVASDPARAFRRQVLSQVDLVSVSPFVVIGSTPDNMFFGREHELTELTERADAASYAIIGGRRVGKTSILGRLHRVRLPAAGFCTLYHDCSTTPTYEDFFSAAIHDWKPEPPLDAPSTFDDLLQTSPTNKPLVLLLDEADKLVPADRAHKWRLFNALRAMANSGRAQVFLSGERTLRDALRDPKSPLFNFANEMLISRLDFRAVVELVTRPMKQLEIELTNEAEIVQRIWDFTVGHPNVVQRLCRRLIERLNEQGTRRITLNDVDAIIEDPGFQRDDFLSTYWEAATLLEKIISLVMADDGNVRTLRAVQQALTERCNLHPKTREVDDALQRLVDLRAILKRTPAGYEFAVEAFPRVVAGTMTLGDMLEVLTEEYQEQGE